MHVSKYFSLVISNNNTNNFFRIPPDCHHNKREIHRCHFGDCPSCRQICNKEYKKCKHVCPSHCHSSVLVKIEGQKASMPWEETGPQIKRKCLPCPECQYPVSVTCLGNKNNLFGYQNQYF